MYHPTPYTHTGGTAMGIRQSVSNFFGGLTKGFSRLRPSNISPLAGLTSMYGGNEPAWSDLRYASLANEGYRKNVYAYACIRQIVMSTASVPWLVKKYDVDGHVDEIDNHPLKDLINRPNELQSWSPFIETFLTDLFISGNAYIYRANKGEGKPPGELWCIRPDRIRVIPGDQLHPVAGYLYIVGKTQVYYPPELIMHIKFYNPLDDWYGMSPLMAAMRSIDSNNELRKWNVALLQNAARPSGALVTPEILDENNYQRLRAMIDELYSGAANAGRPIILEGNLDWRPLSMSPAEMSWGDALRYSSKEIAIALGVPPELVGDNANKTYSNFQEARKAFYIETILPLLRYIQDELNNWLTPLYPDEPYLEYNKDEIEALQDDIARKIQGLVTLFSSGAITVNELRVALGYEEKDGGDDLMAILQQQMIGGGMGGGLMGGPGGAPGGGAPVDLAAVMGGAAPAAGAPVAGAPGTPAAAPGTPGAQPAAGAPAAAAEQKPLTVASIVQELISEATKPEEDDANAPGMPPGGIKSLYTRMYAYGTATIKPSERKERNTDHYTYPLDDNTIGTFNSDKTEVGKYFKGIFVSNLIRRSMPMFQQDWHAMDDLRREILAIIICEGSSRVFPSREAYDEAVTRYSRAMQKGTPDPDGTQWQADPWKNMDVDELYEKAKENYTQLNTMLQSGQYNIMDKRLYPYAAKSLLFARMLYHKLLTMQISGAEAAGKSIFGEETPAAPAEGAPTEGAPAEGEAPAPEENPVDAEIKAMLVMEERKNLAEMTERMSKMIDRMDKTEKYNK